MYLIFTFVEDLQEYLTNKRAVTGNIVRKHSKKLDSLGDLSFPLHIKNWYQIIDKSKVDVNTLTILDYVSPNQHQKIQLENLLNASEKWALKIANCEIQDNDVHLYLERSYVIELCMIQVLDEGINYGLQNKYFDSRINLVRDDSVNYDMTLINLTELRALTVCNVASNLLNTLSKNVNNVECNIKITCSSNKVEGNNVICGPILNESGSKDGKTRAAELFKKRALDMQLMAQHKYGIQVKPTWVNYFEKLGEASVTIEMLQNRTHKAMKITLNSLSTTNKGPSFIFYNCARLSALLRQFEADVLNKKYPELPSIDCIDFTLLNQPEEWEMIYVFILQFPMIVKSCVSDIRKGILNFHNLVFFLSNLSSLFSIYYRRVKILTSAKEHLLPTLFARIYLIKAVQQVFHIALKLLNLEPIKEM